MTIIFYFLIHFFVPMHISNKKAKYFAIKSFESIIVIGYILFEELIWNVFAAPVYQYFKSLNILNPLKNIFLEMNRYLVITVFIIILAIAEALGFLSGFFIINGYFITGIIVYAFKIPIAAFTFWLFDLTEEKLMTFHWLKTTYQYILDWIDKFIHSSVYIYTKARISKLRAKLKPLILKYIGNEGLIASVKKHYLVFKPFVSTIVRKLSKPSSLDAEVIKK